jgi:hypothetical protein
MERLMLFKQPPGGLPGLIEGDHFLGRVPIYGTKDAGRQFWKALRKSLIKAGLKENQILKGFYSYQKDGKVICLMGTHVDDILYATLPEGQSIIDAAKAAFVWGKEEERNFRFCGKDIATQDDGTITVSCAPTILKTNPIWIANGRKNTDPVTAAERTQLKSVAGSLAFVARQCRPDMSYSVSKLQSLAGPGTTVKDLKHANDVLDYAIKTASKGLTFKANVLDWNDMIVGAISDASFCSEKETDPITGKEKKHKSQCGKLIILAPKSLITSNITHFHPISFSSTTQKRICESTLQAETYALKQAVESSDLIRAAVTDCYDELVFKEWERTSAAFLQAVWFCDCNSVVTALLKQQQGKTTEKRTGVSHAAMRQLLWRAKGADLGDPHVQDEPPSNPTDMIRWIDTDVMLADPLTKSMDAKTLVEALDNCYWDLTQPADSLIKKKAKQLARRKTPIDEGEIGSPPSKKKKLQHQQQPIEYSIADDSDFVEPETADQDDEENWDVV